MSKDWVFKRHIRISEDQIRKLPKRPKRPPNFERQKKENREFGQVLISQLQNITNYCRRPEKIIDEDFVFNLRTTKKIEFEGRVLNRLGLNLSLQTSENSAIVTTSPELMEEFRRIVKRYIETSELRSSINEIESISPIDVDKISPEIRE